jgi:hypothetical protein
MDTTSFINAASSAREVRVVVRSGGEELRTPVWIVTTGRSAYLRSYRGKEGRWYQHVCSVGQFPLEIEGSDVLVVASPVSDPATLGRVSSAYQAKYAGESEMPAMVAPEVEATTLVIEPVA